MSNQEEQRQDRLLTTWLIGGSIAFSVALVGVASAASWPAQTVAGLLQILGILLALVGVSVVRSSLKVAGDKALDAKHRLERLSSRSRQQLRRWWDGRRGRPHQIIEGMSIPSAEAWGSATVTATPRPRVDRDAISNRDWLAFLDDRVEAIDRLLGTAEQDHRRERDDINHRLEAHRNELRAEIQRETRQGWQLIVAGLIWSAVGTAVGILG